MVIGYPTYNRILLGEKVSRIFFMATENIQQKTLQEFSSLPTQKTMDTSYEKRGQTFCQHFFSWARWVVETPSSFSLPTFFTLRRHKCSCKLKSWAEKIFLATKKMSTKMYFCPRLHHVAKSKPSDHKKTKGIFYPWSSSRRQK